VLGDGNVDGRANECIVEPRFRIGRRNRLDVGFDPRARPLRQRS
jgi:hypothetical protein